MERRVSLNELIRNAGVSPYQERQPCLPAPTQPAISASEEDHAQARNILLERRIKNPENKGVLKSIFRSSKDKEKTQELGQFSQDELDQALSAVIRVATTGPGVIQAFLGLGAKVNIIETPEKKKRIGNQANTSLRRRSTVLQQAATLRRADSVHILASSGADQTTLDEGLKAALTANDQACIQELLRHGADINKFPNALANAVRSNDQNFVRLLLRAPKPLRPEIISSCLSAAVQQKSDAIVSLLITYGADPNYDSSAALNNTIGMQDYKLAVALVAGPIPLTQQTLQRLLDTTMRLPTCQATLRFLQLLFCCGLPPDSIGLSDLLICKVRSNVTAGAKMMISYGVSTTTNGAECLREAISNGNWSLVDAILQTEILPQHASAALAALSPRMSQPERNRVIVQLVQKGATGPPLSRWILQATKEKDVQLLSLLLENGASIDFSNNSPLEYAITNKDFRTLRVLLNARPSPEALAKVFPLLRTGYTPSERRETIRLLLEHGARGTEVDQALIDAVADSSSTRDGALVADLARGGADVNYDNGKAISIAVTQVDMSALRLLCNANPASTVTSSALPLAFDPHGGRHSRTLDIIDLLLSHGVDSKLAREALQIAISGGSTNIDIVKRLITADSNLLPAAFEYTIALEDPQKKAPILDALLKVGVPQEALDQALAAETNHAVSDKDTTSTKLLLGHGASVSYNDGEALGVAVASISSSLTTLLLSGNHQPSKSSLTKAFRTLFTGEQTETKGKSRLKIAYELLGRGVEQPAIDAALRAVLAHRDYNNNTVSMIELLLQHSANVNTADGACFVFAAQKQDHAIFDKLILHNPKFNIIVPAIICAKLPQDRVVASIKTCFNHGCLSTHLEQARYKVPLLIQTMIEYPRCDALIKLMLAHGCNPDVSIGGLINPPTDQSESTDNTTHIPNSTDPEPLHALLWALNQPQKRISDAVITAFLEAGASVTRVSPASETTALMLAACESRHELISTLLERGSDVDARDIWNRTALFYATRGSNVGIGTVQTLAPYALKNDGSLHEAVRVLRKDVAAILIANSHDPNFPSRLHGGRNALGELCLHAQVNNAKDRSTLRQILNLLLSHGANPAFRARNEKSSVLLALDNAYSALPITEALLETDIWKTLNSSAHLYHDTTTGLSYSPLKYIELLPSPARAPNKAHLLSLLRSAGCEPKYYSTTPLQPPGATGIPPSIAPLVTQQKAHELTLHHAKERHEHTRSLEETSHKDTLRRNRETADAALQAATAAKDNWLALEQAKHEFEVSRVRDAERVKRAERTAWHVLTMEQERDAAGKRQVIEERRAAAEARAVEMRKGEVEHRAGVERRMLREKEEVYERNVGRQREVMRRADESAQLHARLRQERPAIEGAPQWGSVD
jgi:ankyrin repeat protein